MVTCRKGHEHLTKEGKLQCDNGRLGWFTCRGADDFARRGGVPVEGHFRHLSQKESRACDYAE